MSIEEIPKKVNERAVNMLENALERAKNGEIQSLAMAGTSGDGGTWNCFDGSYYPTAVIGELRVLERDIVDCCIDTRRKVAWEFVE